MNELLNSVLLNAVVAAGLALTVWLAGMVPAIRQRPSLRHGQIALSKLKNEKTAKLGVKNKRLKAG